jgi:imidazoleglycerol-phosphate dehydratase
MSTDSRVGEVQRETRETSIEVRLDVDGHGTTELATGIRFLDHMLDGMARHGLLDLTISARGDLDVDCHHTVEDVGIVLGQSLAAALGDRRGIRRYGEATVPMDEALVQVVLDLSGRPFFASDLNLPAERLGDLEVETAAELLRGLATAGGMNLHVRQLAGANTHHILEATFKALGRALDAATRIDGRQEGIPSTKGVL